MQALGINADVIIHPFEPTEVTTWGRIKSLYH